MLSEPASVFSPRLPGHAVLLKCMGITWEFAVYPGCGERTVVVRTTGFYTNDMGSS